MHRAFLKAIKEKEKENLNLVVEYAEVRCSEMEGKGPVLAKSNSLVVDMRNRASGLTIDDIILEPGNFGYCKAMQKECKAEFLTDRWEKGDTKNLVNGRPALTMGAYLICVAGKGKITPYTDGQLEIEILETAKSNGMWLKNLTERRLDLVEMAEDNTYEINPMTNEEWNEGARKLFLEKGVEPKVVEKYPFQKVGG